jgi:hypothetical protein
MRSSKVSAVSGPLKATKTRMVSAHSTPASAGVSPSSRSFRSIKPMFGDSESAFAPVAINMRKVQRLSMSGDLLYGVRLRVCVPLCTINSNNINTTSTTNPNGALGFTQASTVSGGTGVNILNVNTVYLNPWRCGFRVASSVTTGSSITGVTYPNSLFPVFLSQCFNRYRIHGGMKLHYEPQCSTTEPTRYTLAFVNDYYHPGVGERAYQLNIPPQPGTLDDSPNSVSFSGWNAWSAEFPAVSEWKYIYTFPGFGVAPYTDEDRLNFFGALTCVSSGSTQVAGTGNLITGRLFWEFEIELADAFPIVLTQLFAEKSSPLDRIYRSSSHPRACPRDEVKDEEKKEKCVDVVDDRDSLEDYSVVSAPSRALAVATFPPSSSSSSSSLRKK